MKIGQYLLVSARFNSGSSGGGELRKEMNGENGGR